MVFHCIFLGKKAKRQKLWNEDEIQDETGNKSLRVDNKARIVAFKNSRFRRFVLHNQR